MKISIVFRRQFSTNLKEGCKKFHLDKIPLDINASSNRSHEGSPSTKKSLESSLFNNR